jgi:hypothetical protein
MQLLSTLRNRATLFAGRSRTFAKLPNKQLQRKHLSSSSAGNKATIDPLLMEMLCCPLSKSELVYDEASRSLLSTVANVAFPLTKDGQVNMNLSDAKVIDER